MTEENKELFSILYCEFFTLKYEEGKFKLQMNYYDRTVYELDNREMWLIRNFIEEVCLKKMYLERGNSE